MAIDSRKSISKWKTGENKPPFLWPKRVFHENWGFASSQTEFQFKIWRNRNRFPTIKKWRKLYRIWTKRPRMDVKTYRGGRHFRFPVLTRACTGKCSPPSERTEVAALIIHNLNEGNGNSFVSMKNKWHLFYNFHPLITRMWVTEFGLPFPIWAIFPKLTLTCLTKTLEKK